MTRVVNFFAGPSAGKTTNGLFLSAMMKRDRKDILYVPEFPMELCVDERTAEMDDQIYMLGVQNHRLYMAKDKFEWVVTDGPPLQSLAYVDGGLKKYDPRIKTVVSELIRWTHWQYDSVNFFVDRKHRTFRHLGRIHDEGQSAALDADIMVMLDREGVKYTVVSSAEEAYQHLIEHENYTAIS